MEFRNNAKKPLFYNVGITRKDGKKVRILWISRRQLESKLVKVIYVLTWILTVLCAYALGLSNYSVF